MNATYSATTATANAAQPEMILPPGWAWINLRGNLEAQVRRIFAEAWNAGPKDSLGPHVRQLEHAMLEVLREAETAGATALALPIGTPWQVPISISIAFTLAFPEHGDSVFLPPVVNDAQLLTTEAGDAVVELRDSGATFVAAPAELPDPVSLRTIEATWLTPDAHGFLLATATISGVPVSEFAPILDSLTELVVTMLSSVSWKDSSALSPAGDPTL